MWSGFRSPGNHATNFLNKITPKLTWNPMWVRTEPKLHPETANMEFEQVIINRSAIVKGDLKIDLEPKWFSKGYKSSKFYVGLEGDPIFHSVLKKHIRKRVKTWAFCVILPGNPLFPSKNVKKLIRFQVSGGKRTETKTPPRKGRDLFLDMCWVPCSPHNLPK